MKTPDMTSDKFTVLLAEFDTARKRLGQTDDPAERRALLQEVREAIAGMSTLLEVQIEQTVEASVALSRIPVIRKPPKHHSLPRRHKARRQA